MGNYMAQKIVLPPDAFLQVCPSRSVLLRIGQKWTVLAMVALQSSPRRFGDLRRRLEGISQKMLTQTLRAMERDGLIIRQLHDERPVRVEYELAPLGHCLLPIVLALKAWAEEQLHTIEANNRAYDKKFMGLER